MSRENMPGTRFVTGSSPTLRAECPRQDCTCMMMMMYVLLTGADGHEGEDDSADDEGDEVDGEVLSLEVEPRLFLEFPSHR